MAIQQIDQEETVFDLSPQLRGNFNYIRYTRCTFHKDFLMDATVENEVAFIDCTFVGLARFFVNGGEYKNNFTLSFTNIHRVQITGVKLKERTKIVAGLAESIFLQVVKATRFSGGSFSILTS